MNEIQGIRPLTPVQGTVVQQAPQQAPKTNGAANNQVVVLADPKAARAVSATENGGATAPGQALAPAQDAPQILPRVERKAIPGEMIVVYEEAPTKIARGEIAPGARSLGTLGNQGSNRVHMALVSKQAMGKAGFDTTGRTILFTAPNYEYVGDAREGQQTDPQQKPQQKNRGGLQQLPHGPNDPKVADQYHHENMGNAVSWSEGRGRHVIVAVNDDGHDIDHEDLFGQTWINTGEIEGDGIDNDGNGYIDDRYGVDTSSGDVDPRPPSSWDNHGTHVDGIIAARDDNGRGVVGTAPGAKVMPIRWYGSGSWTSAKIAESFIYAANNGAHIANTSYNTNGWPGDKVIESALQYAYDKGMILVASAGNGYQTNPARQVIDTMLFVASTDSADRKSGFSNSGTGIDIAAPGQDILSTVPGGKYTTMSGTSMASPNAAAAFAATMSAHHGWTRAQVVDQVYGTADNIDEANPDFKGLLGAGRVNVGRAIRSTDNPAPKVDLSLVKNRDGTYKMHVDIDHSSVFEDEVANHPKAFQLVQIENQHGWRVHREVQLESTKPYQLGSNSMEFPLPSLEPGIYEFIANRRVLRDPFGQKLTGDHVVRLRVTRSDD